MTQHSIGEDLGSGPSLLEAHRFAVSGSRVDRPALAGTLYTRCEATMSCRHRITIEPGKRGGKPCIRGMRITGYRLTVRYTQ